MNNLESKKHLLVKVETLKNIIVRNVTGEKQPGDDDAYLELRRELVLTPQLDLPDFVSSCRTTKEVWGFALSNLNLNITLNVENFCEKSLRLF